MLPAVIGPRKRTHIIDHHHFARALLEEDAGCVAVFVRADLSRLPIKGDTMSVVTLLAAVVAVAAPVRLAIPPPVRPGIAAYPRITAPAEAAQRRINAAVIRLDARVRTAARECLADSSTRVGNWQRAIAVTMREPEFLSDLISDDVDCGGAHPNAGLAAIVYDLRSGASVDWAALLPTSLTGKLGLVEGEGQSKDGEPRLAAAERAVSRGLRPRRRCG